MSTDKINEMYKFKIKEILLDRGMTQVDLAEAIGLSRPALYKIISGRVFPKPETVKKIADALQVHPASLIEWESDYLSPEIRSRNRAITDSLFILKEINQTRLASLDTRLVQAIYGALIVSSNFSSRDETGKKELLKSAIDTFAHLKDMQVEKDPASLE